MNQNIVGWLSVLSGGAAGASAAVLSPTGPLDTRAIVVAILAFFVGAGAAAKALFTTRTPADPAK
jgi:hypothetical protein